MAVQQDESLTEPLNKDETPRLYSTDLKPSLSQASLNLIVDYKRTLQSDLNRKMFWDFRTWSFLVLIISVYVYIRLSELLRYRTFDAVIHSDDFTMKMFYLCVAVIMIISIAFAVIGELTKFLKEEADSIPEQLEKTFAFDLATYAKLPENEEDFKYENKDKYKTKKEYESYLKEYKKDYAKGENTQLIVYREKPIAVVTIAKDEELSRDDQFVVRINGLSVRRVYASTNVQTDLIQWVYLRARDMYLAEGNLNKDKPLRIFFTVYSFEKRLLSILKELPGWQLVQSEPLPDYIVGKLFGIEKQTWGIGMNITASDKK